MYIQDWKNEVIGQLDMFVEEMELESETGYNNRLLFNSPKNFWKRFIDWKNGERWDLDDENYV